jgi:type IV pilus assembly protein PilW
MQIDYGLDADANGAADSYIAAPAAAADWGNIVSVKINIIARNIETSTGHTDTKIYVLGSAGNFGPFGDAYKRRAYTQVVRLVNPSGRRE